MKEDSVSYPVSFNGKMRFKIDVPADFDKKQVEEAVLNDERASKWLNNKAPRKVMVVPKRIVNIVV
ncbi:MAG: hypothetical protein B6I24_08895 [Bacteroidetes bacterium 4572_128]|nr:MAG: hypothetical protein B6I24_08895 [Bacteroidetes bacterium 4572_128]